MTLTLRGIVFVLFLEFAGSHEVRPFAVQVLLKELIQSQETSTNSDPYSLIFNIVNEHSTMPEGIYSMVNPVE